MKLIQYVIENETGIESFQMASELHEMKIEDYISTCYCPSVFDILKNTPYEKPFVPIRGSKTECKYRTQENVVMCSECWNREVLVGSK